jgi:hypothetical protein
MKGTGEGKLFGQIYSFPKFSAFMTVVLITGTLIISSCTKSNEFTIGDDFVQSQTKLSIVDTFGVKMSTVLLDTSFMVSASSKVALVGTYKDAYLGNVSSESYFDLAYETFTRPDDKAVFDSAAIEMAYSKYYYGDTTALMTMTVHQLTEKIVPFATTTYLYNNSHFAYSPESLGTLKFYPQPFSADTILRIHVDALGEELFNKIVANDQDVSSSEWFMDYIKGFVLVSDSSQSNVVLGFRADNTHLYLKLYYHIDTGEHEDKEISIAMGLANHQFNHVRNNLAGTPLAPIKSNGDVLTSDKTDNKAYLQGLTGLVIKAQFPSLQDLFLSERWQILKAELIVKPDRDSWDFISLPPDENLYIYSTNFNNTALNPLTNSNGEALRPILTEDKVYRENTNYTYDITRFINSQLTNGFFNYKMGLVIGLQQTKMRSTLDRLVINCKGSSVKLRIYYLSY